MPEFKESFIVKAKILFYYFMMKNKPTHASSLRITLKIYFRSFHNILLKYRYKNLRFVKAKKKVLWF